MSENITNVKLLYVPLDNEYKHTLYFGDLTAQLNFFNSIKGVKSFSDFSYQRKDSKLRVNLSFDESLKYNYCMYQNTAYNNKWFFAFITDYEFKREDVTELTLETDVMQTWKFDITIKPSFIDREHTKDDTIGVNTLPENLEIGEYIVNKEESLKPFTSMRIVVGLTGNPFSDGEPYVGTRYTGSYSGIRYLAFDHTTEGINLLNINLRDIYSQGTSDCITTMFLAPAELTEKEIIPEGEDFAGTETNLVKTSENPYNKGFDFPKTDFMKFSGYTPKNNKLFCYPYNYLLVSNNNGGSAIYQFEHFSEDSIFLTVYGVLTPGCSIRMIPMNYKGILLNHEEGLNLGKYPICNWASDEYTNWLTQNSINIGVDMVKGLGSIVAGGVIAAASGGLAMAVGGSSILGGISTITGQLQQIHQMSFTAPQSNGNINCGDVVTAINQNTFTLYQMCCKPENMRVIDEYFSAYGYKTNRIKVPNTNHRERWWFTKTVDVNILGEIPINDKATMKSVYDKGITFWRNVAEIENYELSNDIV